MLTSSCRMLDLDYVGSRLLLTLRFLILPTSVVGSYRAVHRVPKISQYLRTVWLFLSESSNMTGY
jgi:hypothetical protein